MNMTTRLSFVLAIGALLAGSASAGSLEPPPGPVSATRPPDRCFDMGTRFTDCENGTVKDTKTGLFWLKDANCFGFQGWVNASISVAGLGHGQCGLTDGSLPGDWRLPTVNCSSGSCQPIETATGELASIFNSAVCNAAPYVLNRWNSGCWTAATSPFSGVQSGHYWSSSPNDNDPNRAWSVYLSSGVVADHYSKINAFYVWPVRGGP